LDTIENAISEVARRLVMLAQKYMTTDAAVRVTGPNGTAWVTAKPEDVQGEFDFEVVGGSTQPQNDTFKRQQATQLLQTLAPFMTPPGQPGYINVPALLTEVLRDGFGFKNPEKLVQDPTMQPAIDPATGQPIPGQMQEVPPGTPPPGQPPPGEPSPLGPPGTPPGSGVASPQPPGEGIQGVPPAQLAQLQGQIGFNP
jgi:hypothetical protein